MSVYQEVERQIDLGNLWKAKEILQGRLAGTTYDRELYEEYGKVLLAMHDDMEAGKYLFLSGVRHPSYEKAIYLYLNRYGGKTTGALFHTFPHSAQISPIESFPTEVLEVLEKAGHARSAIKGKTRPSEKVDQSSDFIDKLRDFAVISIFLLLLVGLLAQAFRGVAWIFQWIF